jgi:hypothetical protein
MDDQRLKQLNGMMGDLCYELQSLVERARPLVEEFETDYGIPALRPHLPPETQMMFGILQRLITMK